MADSPSSPIRKKMPTAEYSPTPGCIILVIGGVAILTLIIWFVYAGLKQAREIKTFTDDKASIVVLPKPTPEQLKEIRTRLAAYAKAIEESKPADLSLSKEDLNLLIAGDETLESIRSNVAIKQIGEVVTAAVSFPLNGIGEKRYLNGEMEFTPVVKPSSGLAVDTKSISVPGKTVSEGFVNLYREMNFLDDMLLKAFREHPVLGAPLKKTTSVTLEGGSVVLHFAPK